MNIYELKRDELRKVHEVSATSSTDLKLDISKKDTSNKKKHEDRHFDELLQEEIDKLRDRDKEIIEKLKEQSEEQTEYELDPTYKKIRRF